MLGPPPDDENAGPGCMVWGLIGLFGLALAVLVVVMAAAAGWTTGQREADRLATATQAVVINEQLARIPTDVADGNEYILRLRLSHLEQYAPNLPQLPALQITATAVYMANLPTVTPTPTATQPVTATAEVTAVPTQAAVDAPPEITAEVSDSGEVQYDLPGLLQRARDQIAIGEYDDAYEVLDAIIRIDDQFQRATVRQLMLDVLTNQAEQLYFSTDTLAEAIRLTDIAEQYGDIGSLNFERYMASLYLSAQSALTARNIPLAIEYINEMRTVGQLSDYKGQNLNRLLFDAYVDYAQAFEFGSEPCRALVQYNNALNLFDDAGIQARRDNAQTACEQGTPTPGPPGAEGQPTIAPIGVPGT